MVTDRPWALTLATLARRGMTAEITLVSGQKRYTVAVEHGAIVAASSPMTADSAVRVALTSHLILPSQVNELNRRMTANPTADEVDLIGEVAKLPPAKLDKLRADVITRRAARTFAPEDGEFIIDDTISLPTRASAVDFRAVVYYGVRMHVSDARLSNELRALGGSYFILNPDAVLDLDKFNFCDGEGPLIAALGDGATIAELEARHRDIDPRTMLAAIYALFACGAIQLTTPPATSRVPTQDTVAPRTQTATLPRTHTHTVPRTQTGNVPRTQTATIPRPPAPATAAPPPLPLPPPPPSPRAPSPPTVPHAQARGRRSTNSPPHVAFARGTMDSVHPPEPPKSNPELAAEAAERARRALAADKPEAAVLDLKKALELVPNHVDYNALLGWALFCAADDKVAIAAESRKLLEKAVYKSQRPEVAQFYLGRVERILGRDKEALRHFQAVLDAQPNHRDASAEVRVLEARLKRLGISIN